MEKTPPSSTLTRLLSSYIILHCDIRVQKFLINLQLFFQFLLNFVSTKWELWSRKKNLNTEVPLKKQQFCLHEKGCDGKVSKGDIKMVMDRLGVFYDPDENELEQKFGEDEVLVLFEEASLEEVKEAFDVLDDNRDGFIDAIELQRVMYCLGLEEGSEVEQCRRMIKAFDENGDGLIDFNEFLKLMEKCSS